VKRETYINSRKENMKNTKIRIVTRAARSFFEIISKKTINSEHWKIETETADGTFRKQNLVPKNIITRDEGILCISERKCKLYNQTYKKSVHFFMIFACSSVSRVSSFHSGEPWPCPCDCIQLVDMETFWGKYTFKSCLFNPKLKFNAIRLCVNHFFLCLNNIYKV